jgi:3-hydroxyacyl-[acyl-carrier-protein] dehydratase
MSIASHHPQHAGPPPSTDQASADSGKFVIDLSQIDLTKLMYTREQVMQHIPHRGDMLLIDGIVWESADHTKGVAIKRIRGDEFWVKGHFPERPLLPAVLMVEAGAQLACFLYNIRMPEPKIVAFVRIDNAAFRSMVQPGDNLYLLCSETKFGRRRFVSDIQGVVNGRLAFEASISGMNVDPEYQRKGG